MNPQYAKPQRLMLEREGYEVLTAADGVDALHALSKSLPDLIISDLNMPRMSGFEFLAVVRERFPHIATIAISGEYIASENPSGSFGGRFPAKRTLHSQGAFPRNREAFGGFSHQLGKKEKRDCPTLRAERQSRVSNNHVPQMPASQQTGSDEFERRNTPNDLPVMWHASEI